MYELLARCSQVLLLKRGSDNREQSSRGSRSHENISQTLSLGYPTSEFATIVYYTITLRQPWHNNSRFFFIRKLVAPIAITLSQCGQLVLKRGTRLAWYLLSQALQLSSIRQQ
jgi:hypothetical protein